MDIYEPRRKTKGELINDLNFLLLCFAPFCSVLSCFWHKSGTRIGARLLIGELFCIGK